MLQYDNDSESWRILLRPVNIAGATHSNYLSIQMLIITFYVCVWEVRACERMFQITTEDKGILPCLSKLNSLVLSKRVSISFQCSQSWRCYRRHGKLSKRVIRWVIRRITEVLPSRHLPWRTDARGHRLYKQIGSTKNHPDAFYRGQQETFVSHPVHKCTASLRAYDSRGESSDEV